MANMSIERLHEIMEENSDKDFISWKGNCHDCSADTEVRATPVPEGIRIEGGSVYEPETNKFFIKCGDCYERDAVLKNYQNCEVYSRVVGYLRPVAQWNDAKQEEFENRKLFNPDVA